ncbi:MAG: beta-propeller fold lactonase family protein, partial [Cyclobacteriaceae bacterium]|nr:beta-propeller fold lactonase family protein [Cyclobacteriaceae bacterium]
MLGLQPDGSILVPTNQYIKPAGFQVYFNGRPVDLALSPNGKWLAVLNKNSLELIRIKDRTIIQRLPIRKGGSYNGVSFSADGKKIYVSQARDHIFIAEMNADNVLNWADEITFSEAQVGGHPVPGGFVLEEQNDKLYTTLNRSNSLAIVKLSDKTIKEIPVGISPYEVLLLSPQKAYVSNWGGRQPREGEATYKSSKSDVLIDPETGIANNGSVSVVDLKKGKEIKNIEVGLHPTAMVFSPDKERLYVACANSDFVSVIDTKSDEVIDEISVHIGKDLPFGSAPNALAISKEGTRLYIANGTDNAICVVELSESNKLLGFIPTGWYPGAVMFDKNDEHLIVANTKGIGSRNLRA